jgi:hypothetical protein
MILSNRMKAAVAVGGAAAALVFTAAPAFAAGTPTGNEAITTPVSVPAQTLLGGTAWMPPVDANANPINGIAGDTITGTGYDVSGGVVGMVCDGKNPAAAGYQVTLDCDALTSTAVLQVGVNGNPAGQVTLNFNTATAVGAFRGVGPNDQFNCLATADNPNGTTVTESGSSPAGIDPTVPSWGSSTVGAQGGGTTPCNIRVGYSGTTLSATADRFFPLNLPQNPGSPIPESPLTIALPIGGVVLFGAAGAVLYRKRRSHAAA